MQTCTRRIQFCAGHRVHGHENKCAHIHGHNYVAYITAVSARDEATDDIGRVIDFSVLKDRVGGWIDKYWDHAMLYYQHDYEIAELYSRDGPLNHMKHHILLQNPTAENMADFILRLSNGSLLHDEPITVTEVTLWETENCFATATV